MIYLRGHHLICLHFFLGEGYNAPFVENLRYILQKLENEKVEVISTADDICTKCPYLKDYKCTYDENSDEKIKEMDETALKLLNLSVAEQTIWNAVRACIPGIFDDWRIKYCNECDWRDACQKNSYYKEMKKI